MKHQNSFNYKHPKEQGIVLKERIDKLVRNGLIAKSDRDDLIALGPLIASEYKNLYKTDAPKEKRKEGNQLFWVRVYPKEFIPIMDNVILDFFKNRYPKEAQEEGLQKENEQETGKKRKRIHKVKSVKIGSSD